MSDLPAIEMGAVDRPNRFQVNPVNKSGSKKEEDEEIPPEIYRRLQHSDGEQNEDDTFNENAPQIIQKRTSRLVLIK